MKTLPTLFLTLASLCLGLSGCSKKAADSEAPKAGESEPLQDVTGSDEGGEAPTGADPAAKPEIVPSAASDDMQSDGDEEDKDKKSGGPGTTKAIDDPTEQEGEEEEEQPIE